MKDDLRMGKLKPALATYLDRVVEDIVHPHDTEVWELPMFSLDVVHRIARQADLALPGTVFEHTVYRPPTLVHHGGVIDGIVRAACKLIDIVRDADGERVM